MNSGVIHIVNLQLNLGFRCICILWDMYSYKLFPQHCKTSTSCLYTSLRKNSPYQCSFPYFPDCPRKHSQIKPTLHLKFTSVSPIS